MFPVFTLTRRSSSSVVIKKSSEQLLSNSLAIMSSVRFHTTAATTTKPPASFSSLDDDLLLNSSDDKIKNRNVLNNNNNINSNNNKAFPNSSVTSQQQQKRPPVPPSPAASSSGMIRPKLVMKPIVVTRATTTSTPAATATSAKIPSKSPTTATPLASTTPRVSLKSIKPMGTSTTTTKPTTTTTTAASTKSPSVPPSPSSSPSDNSATAEVTSPAHHQHNLQRVSVESLVVLSDDSNEKNIDRVVESCELIIPSQGGLALAELFAILSPEDRSVIRKSKSKLLAKFLQNFPDKFALSPQKIIVCLVAGYNGDRELAAHYARVTESLTITTPEFVSGGVLGGKNNNNINNDENYNSDDNSDENSNSSNNSNKNKNKKVVEPLSAEDLEQLNNNYNPFFASDYKPVTAADEVVRLEQSMARTGEHHKLVLHSVPPPDLVNLSTVQQCGDRVRTPSEFKNSVDVLFENVLSTQTLVKFVPTWFVPATEVVAMMGEGYTEDHFEQFFGDSSAVEVVTLMEQKFVRLHGGNKHKCLVDFDNAEAREAESLFAHYRPDPQLVLEILKVCPPRGQWVPLYEVWTRLPPEVQSKFPFQGPLSLTYFAQMQHIFSFSPNDGGGIAIPHGLPGHLHWDTTPFVKQLHAIFSGLLNGKRAFVGDLLDQFFPKHSPSRKPLREALLRGLILARAVHGTGLDPQFAFSCDVEQLEGRQVEDLMRVFVSLHQNVFAYKEESILMTQQQINSTSTTCHFLRGSGDSAAASVSGTGPGGHEADDNNSNNNNNNNNNNDDDDNYSSSSSSSSSIPITPETIQNKIGRTVLLRFEFEAEERHNLDIPAQIEIAKQRGNNKMVRKLKRKLMILQQPDNPLLEEENLAKAIAEFLPPDRSIAWPRLKKNLPMEIMDMVPADRKRFFHKWSQYFRKFDVGVLHNHNIHLQLPHLPPPPGAFRGPGEYTQEELLSAMGQVLLRGPKNVASLCSALPDGIHDSLRLMFGGVAQAVQQNPQYFAIVIKDVRNKDLRTATVTLIQVPNLTVVEDNLCESERAAEENRTVLAQLGKEQSSSSSGFGGADDRGGDGNEDDGGLGGGRGDSTGGGSDVWGQVIVETVGGDAAASLPPPGVVSAHIPSTRSHNPFRNSSSYHDVSSASENRNDLWTEMASSSASSSPMTSVAEGKGNRKMMMMEQKQQLQVEGDPWSV